MSPEQIVELPFGTRHQNTTVIAESWVAWDELTVDDGWVKKVSQRSSELVWKVGEIRGHEFTVLPPQTPRGTA